MGVSPMSLAGILPLVMRCHIYAVMIGSDCRIHLLKPIRAPGERPTHIHRDRTTSADSGPIPPEDAIRDTTRPTLASTFVQAASHRGEEVLYLNFEESRRGLWPQPKPHCEHSTKEQQV
jgi:hypothetical protein